MGKIKKQIKSEIKHLPFTLSKLTGGTMAVIGFPGVIIIITRKSNPSYLDIMPYFILGIIGVSVFLLSSRLFEKRMNENTDFVPTTKKKKHISIISWMIFLIFIASCILITFIMTM
jgi:hypothetical protein